MMYLHVLIMIRLSRGSLPTNMAGIRPQATMYAHMIFEIIGPMKRFPADLTTEHFLVLVLFDMSLAVVLSDELSPAVIASVGPDALMRVHVSDVVGLPDEGALALVALEGLGHPRRVRPLVQLQVPLGREVLIADQASVGSLAAVVTYVDFQRGLQVHPFANGTLHVLRVLVTRRKKPVVVRSAHVPR